MPKPTRDRKYLAFVRTLPCSVCGTRKKVQAHHTGQRGMSQKADDRTAIPLCELHHQEWHQIGRRDFCTKYSLDVDSVVASLTAEPRIRIEEGCYVTEYRGRLCLLGSVEAGLEQASRKLRMLLQEAA